MPSALPSIPAAVAGRLAVAAACSAHALRRLAALAAVLPGLNVQLAPARTTHASQP